MKSGDLPAALLQRKAIVYIRQSSPNQVVNNPESQRRQYELVEAARHHGFGDIETVDDDLGRTASGMQERPGFDRLLTLMYEDRVGAVLCLDATRLARNGRDWEHLLEVCGFVDARIIDLDGVYDPNLPNDRLLLGLLCGVRHNSPYVGQPAMSGSMRNPLSTGVLSPGCLT